MVKCIFHLSFLYKKESFNYISTSMYNHSCMIQGMIHLITYKATLCTWHTNPNISWTVCTFKPLILLLRVGRLFRRWQLNKYIKLAPLRDKKDFILDKANSKTKSENRKRHSGRNMMQLSCVFHSLIYAFIQFLQDTITQTDKYCTTW